MNATRGAQRNQPIEITPNGHLGRAELCRESRNLNLAISLEKLDHRTESVVRVHLGQ
jgi:hypothetical protein